MFAVSRVLFALLGFLLLSEFAMAAQPKGAGVLRFSAANSGAAWPAGSKQKVKLDGPAIQGALGIRYRWMDEKSTLLLAGFIRRNGMDEWNDEILVPMYSVKGHPHLIIEIAKARRKTLVFRSGKEFNLPAIKGLVIDNQPPKIADSQFNENEKGYWVEIEVKETSGVAEALLVMGANKDSEAIKGACRTAGGKTTCLYFLPKDLKDVSLTAQITDLAGNRTTASIQNGSRK